MVIKDLILSIIQGITEFLPISSSGHLLIFNKLFGASADLFFIIVLHLGTVFSLIIFFFKDIIKYLRSIVSIAKILIVAVFTGGMYIMFKAGFEGFFTEAGYFFIPLFLVINGIILIFANKRMERSKRKVIYYSDSVLLGILQSLAFLPGISRSGITISTLLFRGVNKNEAFKFSFIAAIPVIIGSFVFKAAENDIALVSLLNFRYIAGFLVSFLVGYISLFILSAVIKKAALNFFGYYCWLAALGILLLSLY